MSLLARKRRRDLWHMRGQVLVVALVAAVGVANLVMSRATLESLETSRDRYYREYAFADVFAEVKRAPERVARRIEAISGVAIVDTRVTAFGRAEVEGFGDSIRIQAVSTPEFGQQRLNRLHLIAGRAPEAGERNTLAVSDAFAQAHALRPGARLTLVLHGRRQAFRIVGIAGSPEYVAQMPPQAVFPDPHRFAIVWLPRPALEAALDMDGAFNSLTISLSPQAGIKHVLDELDRVLKPYGGIGAIGRDDQRSHRYLSEEFRQLRTMTRLFPTVFLGVSAFVLYVVLGRLIAGQREQIGTLKAFGFERREIWYHYAGFAVAIGLLGAVLGLALGIRLGTLLADLYREFYRLPFLDFGLSAGVIWIALAVSIGSALLGAAVPVWRAARLPPAEAMRPDVPWQRARPRSAAVAGATGLSQAHRLIMRNLLQRPIRSLLTLLGLSLGTAIMLMGRFQNDSLDKMVTHQFERSERHDVAVSFVEPMSPGVLTDLHSVPGVRRVEAERAIAVEVRHRAARHRTALIGLSEHAELKRPLDRQDQPIQAPLRGVLLTDFLAGMLDAQLGDIIELETLSGRRQTLHLPLAGMVSEPFGVQAYVSMAEIDRLIVDGARVSGAVMTVDSAAMAQLLAELERRPKVAAVSERRLGIRNFYDSMAETILTFTLISTLFGAVITAGVVYSSARVALSERARDLASLRILGFTEGEVGYLLLGELSLLTVLAIPLGFVLGNALIAMLVRGFDSDLFRIPHFVSPATYGIAGITSLIAALLAGGLVWRRIHELDMIGVLKARD